MPVSSGVFLGIVDNENDLAMICNLRSLLAIARNTELRGNAVRLKDESAPALKLREQRLPEFHYIEVSFLLRPMARRMSSSTALAIGRTCAAPLVRVFRTSSSESPK